ncbi:aldehyde dehydrogenase family protein [Microvirga brassicacearum]|uniref:Salicylaldehyde dehydrogenase n=1 Tax=Microvirga brassicacearum TaxID=2580413 RepID=A0A5N3P7B7_9HYPH|nr:aldehyde dehydrogenase family protein [Microvirga brassicacearum]KAB0265575.1 aldehyde dehydrogenase family protein [Microvirga brassicacearum]
MNFGQKLSQVRPYADFDTLAIAGTWRKGRSNKVNRDLNPYTGEVLIEIPQASRDDLDEAYASAAKAQIAWAERLPGERAEVMRRAAVVMEARREEIIGWLIRESGSTRIKATLEWETVHAVMLEASSLPYLVEGRILPADVHGKESRVYRKPVGVVGVISPWNWPMQLTNRSLAPALAVGNAVVVKPASDTPVTGGLLLARIFEEAGLPPGALNVVVGAGSEIGDAFVQHPVPRVISFTGSTPVGRGIARLAAEASVMKRVDLELGGNSPFIVLDDADLEQAVEAAVFGKFLHQGQICMITNRFIVDEVVYEPFLGRFAERVRGLRVGDPDQPDTVIGPIINQRQLEGLQARLKEAQGTGPRQVVGGEPEGLVLPPHVFADVTNEMPLAREESFGPIAPVIRAKNEEDALRIANDTEYGLSSCVFTQDLERGVRFAQRVQAGMTHVNDQPVNDLPFSPFGGEKNSGIGRFNGKWGIEAFTTDHWITIQHTPRAFPPDAHAITGPWAGG